MLEALKGKREKDLKENNVKDYILSGESVCRVLF